MLQSAFVLMRVLETDFDHVYGRTCPRRSPVPRVAGSLAVADSIDYDRQSSLEILDGECPRHLVGGDA